MRNKTAISLALLSLLLTSETGNASVSNTSDHDNMRLENQESRHFSHDIQATFAEESDSNDEEHPVRTVDSNHMPFSESSHGWKSDSDQDGDESSTWMHHEHHHKHHSESEHHSSHHDYDDDNIPSVPLPASLWFMGTALIGLLGVSRKSTHQA